jgi:hypothetical protein
MKTSFIESSSDRVASLISLIGLSALGCGVPAEIDSFDSNSTAEEQEPLLGGGNDLTNCPNQADKDRLIAKHLEGRMVSRSAAFLECVAFAAHDGLQRFENGSGPLGPYGTCSGDPIQSATLEQRVARILSVTASRLDTRHTCNPDLVCSCQAMAGAISAGEDQAVTWRTTVSSSGLLWHEVAHNHDYHHGTCNESGDGDETDPGDHSANNIIGGCMKEIVAQSALAPACASLSCATNELRLVSRYGEYGTGDACECVPDVFSWPGNQNEANDRFGASLAAGDFNGDGFTDLAVGVPNEGNVGAVYVYKGSVAGLRFWKRTSQFGITAVEFHPSFRVFNPVHGGGDDFGAALAAADLNADGFDELIVGTPGRATDAGGVYIYGGTAQGPNTSAVMWLDQSDNGGSVSAGDRYGAALAVGNFNGDSFTDLAVGSPFEVLSGAQSGVVGVLRGRAGVAGSSAFVVSDGGFLHQGMGPWSNENGDEFGSSLAAGDIDSDGLDDVIIGAPGENGDSGFIFRAEKVSGSWALNLAVTASPAAFRYGEVLAVGDVVSSTSKDIVVGSPRDASNGGSIWLYRGLTSGPSLITKITHNEVDLFGSSIAIGNVTGSSKRDVIVGAPGEAFGSGPLEGRVLVYAGTSDTAFSTTFADEAQQGDFFVAGSSDTILPPEGRGADEFGGALAVGAFNGTTGYAVGAPKDEVDGALSGAVFTFSASGVGGRKIDQVSMRHGAAWPPQ